MNMRMVLLAVFAVVAAAVTFLLAKTWIDSQRDQLRRQQEAATASKAESVNVLVAKANLPSGLILAREHVEWKPWPANTRRFASCLRWVARVGGRVNWKMSSAATPGWSSMSMTRSCSTTPTPTRARTCRPS